MEGELDRTRLEHILDAICHRLQGEWLLVGGALATLWVAPRRTTEDVDIMGLAGTSEERLALLQLADEIGLPIEALNSAADFFVRRVPGWRDEIEVFRTGPGATIYRPTPTLFLLLKVRRLSERDLQDCLDVLERAGDEHWHVDADRIRAALDSLPPTHDEDLQARRTRLRQSLPHES